MGELRTLDELPDIYTGLPQIEEAINLYKEDLIKYTQITKENTENPNIEHLKQYLINKLEEKWTRVLGFNRTRILGDIHDLVTPKLDFTSSLTLKEALSYYKPGASWLIPNLLRRSGLYVLAALPKTGKTILVNFLMKAMILSNEFLGMPAKPGKVLYIQLEESLDTISERLMLTGFGDVLDEQTSLIVNFTDCLRIERKFDALSDLEWLIGKIQEFRPDLVIIDSLRAANKTNSNSENTNEYGRSVYALQSVFNYTNTCGVVIHHMRKNGGTNSHKISLVDLFAGHGSISAASDGLIGLLVDEKDESRVITLKTLPRQGVPLSIQYQLKTIDGLWELVKLHEDSPAKTDHTSRILRFLANNPDQYFTGKQIASKINSDVLNLDFRQSMRYLEDSQIIIGQYSNKKFSYGITSESLWIVDPKSAREMLSPKIIDANALMVCQTKRELRDTVKDWDEERKLQATRVLLREERDRIKNLILSWEFSEGDKVIFEGTLFQVENIVDAAPSLSDNRYFLTGLDQSVLETELSKPSFEEEAQYIFEEPIPITKDNLEEPVEDEEDFCFELAG